MRIPCCRFRFGAGDKHPPSFSILVGVGIAPLVVDIPTQRLEERVEELAAQLGLVVLTGPVMFPMQLKGFTKSKNAVRWLGVRHGERVSEAGKTVKPRC